MSVTLIAGAPSITWLLVSTSPDEVTTMPVPAASALWYPRVETMSTRPGSTRDAICDVLSAVLAEVMAAIEVPSMAYTAPAPNARPTAATLAVIARRRRLPCPGGSPPRPPPPPRPACPSVVALAAVPALAGLAARNPWRRWRQDAHCGLRRLGLVGVVLLRAHERYFPRFVRGVADDLMLGPRPVREP